MLLHYFPTSCMTKVRVVEKVLEEWLVLLASS